MAALRCITAARSGFLLAAAPFGRRAGQPSEGAPTRTARSPRASKRSTSPFAAAGKRVRDSRASARTRTPRLAIFSTPGTDRDGSAIGSGAARSCWRRRAVRSAGKRGQTRVGWYACPRLTLFATEWSATRRKPLRAAAIASPITNLADVKARRLPTSGRRKFPSGNFRSARDLEGAKRVNRGKAQRANPNPSPFARRPHRTPRTPQPLRPVPIC